LVWTVAVDGEGAVVFELVQPRVDGSRTQLDVELTFQFLHQSCTVGLGARRRYHREKDLVQAFRDEAVVDGNAAVGGGLAGRGEQFVPLSVAVGWGRRTIGDASADEGVKRSSRLCPAVSPAATRRRLSPDMCTHLDSIREYCYRGYPHKA